MTMTITVGVLALQGAFVEHITLLRQAAGSIIVNQPSSLQHHERQCQQGDARQHADGRHVVLGSTGPAVGCSGAGEPCDDDINDSGIRLGDPDSHRQGEHQHEQHQSSLPQPDESTTEAGRAAHGTLHQRTPLSSTPSFSFIEVRTPQDLALCSALIIPGGESTAISLIASRTNLLEPLREFVKISRRPVWGTCAGLILLAERADRSKATGQELIGGLDVRVQRNYFGRQVESFEAELDLEFLKGGEKFRSVFIRAPVVAKVLGEEDRLEEDGVVVAPLKRETRAKVEVLGRLPGRARTIRDRTTTAEDLGEDGDIIAVKQGNVFGTAFHPELTGDPRIHAWWLSQVMEAERERLRD